MAEGASEVRRRGGKGEGDAKPDQAAVQKDGASTQESLQGEYGNIFLLLVLYTLQGIPMGLSAVLPMILKERNVSYSDIGTFSLNSWPFSLKLFWAPIVDTVYVKSVGRRKTWLVPSQLVIGIVMIGLSTLLDDLLYVEKPAVITLTVAFFALYFLCATQDIAVDGWALTMLREENVGYAATCNAAGQTLGYALGFTGFMLLEQYNILSLAGFMFWLGLVFIVVTVAVAIGKEESPVPPEHEPEDLATSYQQMLAMVRLKPVRHLIGVLATWKMAFAISDSVAPLKFQEYGVPKEHMTYMTSLLMPMYIALPIVASKWTTGATPMNLALRSYPWRVVLLPCMAALACVTPATVQPIPWGFYSLIFAAGAIGAVASEFMFVAQMAFFARISDPAMGGTYMTLLNTLANLGAKWPSTVTFYLVDATTCRAETCIVKSDGFYVVSALCAVIGAVWLVVGAPYLRRLQNLKVDDWKVR